MFIISTGKNIFKIKPLIFPIPQSTIVNKPQLCYTKYLINQIRLYLVFAIEIEIFRVFVKTLTLRKWISVNNDFSLFSTPKVQ
jgi:hypothetical protein